MTCRDEDTNTPTPKKPRRNPARERRYPPGCPDPDWCSANGCWWDCQGEDAERLDREERERAAARRDPRQRSLLP